MKNTIILLSVTGCLLCTACQSRAAAFTDTDAVVSTTVVSVGTEETESVAESETESELESKVETKAESKAESESETKNGTFLLSNMADAGSREEVTAVLQQYFPEENVQQYMDAVKDYNDTVQGISLNQGFENTVPEYAMDRISALWKEQKGNYIGTDCRISAFMLMKGVLQIQQGETDDTLLFLDNDAISEGKLFTPEETEQFRQLFSRVATESTEDVRVHAEKMQEHLSKIKFSDKVEMVSVVLHDNLAGDYLFVGHVGVLMEQEGQYLFVEKLSFDEPYQALKFSSKEDCYDYLLQKYEDYTDEGAAKPFIMANGELVLQAAGD